MSEHIDVTYLDGDLVWGSFFQAVFNGCTFNGTARNCNFGYCQFIGCTFAPDFTLESCLIAGAIGLPERFEVPPGLPSMPGPPFPRG